MYQLVFQGPFSLVSPKGPSNCFFSAFMISEEKVQERMGEAHHVLIIEQPLPPSLALPQIIEQIIAFLHLRPEGHTILLHRAASGYLHRDVFVRCIPTWKIENGVWKVAQQRWGKTRGWEEERCSLAEEEAYTHLLYHLPIHLTFHKEDPLRNGGPVFEQEIRDGIRLVKNRNGLCLLSPGSGDYLTLWGVIPCFRTEDDVRTFLDSCQPPLIPALLLPEACEASSPTDGEESASGESTPPLVVEGSFAEQPYVEAIGPVRPRPRRRRADPV